VTPGFVTLPERDRYWLRNATVPAALLTELPAGAQVSPDGLAVVDLQIRDARIAAIVAAGGLPEPQVNVDLARGQIWPCLIDVHTHLDKGHTWERAPNPDGSSEPAKATRWRTASPPPAESSAP
jgi:cytosine deaminase